MTQTESLQSSDRRAVAFSLLAGGVHAALVAALVAWLDYPVDALEVAPGGIVGALVGLVAALAVPTYVALRVGVVGPLLVVLGTAAWSVYRELSTPAPEFSELGGHTVVSGVRYVDAYVDAWYVWLFAGLLVGAVEYVLRSDRPSLPAPARGSRVEAVLGRESTRTATGLAAVAHVTVLLALAADSGYFAPDGFLPSPWYVGLAVLAWTVLGLAVVGGLAALSLVRWRLVAPTGFLAWLVWETGRLQTTPLPDDPLPVYFVGWFFFAGLLLVAGGVEMGLRRLGRWVGGRPTVDR